MCLFFAGRVAGMLQCLPRAVSAWVLDLSLADVMRRCSVTDDGPNLAFFPAFQAISALRPCSCLL